MDFVLCFITHACIGAINSYIRVWAFCVGFFVLYKRKKQCYGSPLLLASCVAQWFAAPGACTMFHSLPSFLLCCLDDKPGTRSRQGICLLCRFWLLGSESTGLKHVCLAFCRLSLC